MIEYLVASSYQLITIHILSIPNYKHMIRENYKRNNFSSYCKDTDIVDIFITIIKVM